MLRALLSGYLLVLSARAQEPQLRELGRILSHDLKVVIHPGDGLTIEDRLRVRVLTANGLVLQLNPAAQLETVSAPHRFAGGRLQVDVPRGEANLTLRYSLPVPHDPADPNDACFRADSGHVRNQFFWHPSFGVDSAGAWADFHVEIRIPRDYQVATDLPQTERVEGPDRIVEARTVQRAALLTLAYDRDWQVETREFDGIRLALFLTPGFNAAPSAVADEFRRVYKLLSKRFGPLPAQYAAIVQARNLVGTPWRFASNQAVFSVANPGQLFRQNNAQPPAWVRERVGGVPPDELFAHEVSHLWNLSVSGAARNFLAEGWAVWAESLVLQSRYGPDPALAKWRLSAAAYLGAFDGRMGLLEDTENSGMISYIKGPWIFHMLEDALGPQAFDQALSEFMTRSRANPAGWEVLAECVQRHRTAGFRRSRLPPALDCRKDRPEAHLRNCRRYGDDPPGLAHYFLPLVVEVGGERRRIWLKGAETRITFPTTVTDVKLDPDQLLLLRR
jgi:hypothetical protein